MPVDIPTLLQNFSFSHYEKCAIESMHRFQNGSSVNGKCWLVSNDIIASHHHRIYSQIINDIHVYRLSAINIFCMCYRPIRSVTQTITSFSLLLFIKLFALIAHTLHTKIVHTPYALYTHQWNRKRSTIIMVHWRIIFSQFSQFFFFFFI